MFATNIQGRSCDASRRYWKAHGRAPRARRGGAWRRRRMSGPLEGVRILDITTVLMGPYATQILGDLGADVIKVEPPAGDNVRGIGPGRHADMGGIFLHANRSKRSIALDLKNPAGRQALLKVAATCDVLVYNVRPQAMARLGLSYAEVAQANPSIL